MTESIKLFLLLSMMISLPLQAKEYKTTKTIFMYRTEKMSDKILTILTKSVLKTIKEKNRKSKVEIIYEPTIKGRRNRKGITGWISSVDILFNTTKTSSDPVKKTVSEISDQLNQGVEIDITCTPTKENDSPQDISDSTLAGCEELENLDMPGAQISEQRLNQCVDSIINLGKKGAEIKGSYIGIGKKKMKKLSRKKFFSNLLKKLTKKELDFIGHILTTSGEAYGLTMTERINPPKIPPHLQEMMGISMVLENRKKDTIEKAQWFNNEMQSLKSKYRLSPDASEDQVYSKMRSEISRINSERLDLIESSKKLRTKKEVKEYGIKIGKKQKLISKKKRHLSKLKSVDHLREDTSILDIALDGNGVQFSMYSSQEPAMGKVPNYPHWYKTISPDFKKARQTSVKSFIKFQEIKKSLPTNIMNYYSTILKKPPSWAKSKGLTLKTITINDHGKKLRLNSDPIFTSKPKSTATYKCGATRTGETSLKRVGHCFYAGSWQYHGHNFGDI